MKVVILLMSIIAFLWLYSVVVTEAPFGLDKTPATYNEITLKNIK